MTASTVFLAALAGVAAIVGLVVAVLVIEARGERGSGTALIAACTSPGFPA